MATRSSAPPSERAVGLAGAHLARRATRGTDLEGRARCRDAAGDLDLYAALSARPAFPDTRRVLAALAAPLDPPPRFDPYDFKGLAAPSETELDILDRPVLSFEDPAFPPPPSVDGLLPERPVAFEHLFAAGPGGGGSPAGPRGARAVVLETQYSRDARQRAAPRSGGPAPAAGASGAAKGDRHAAGTRPPGRTTGRTD